MAPSTNFRRVRVVPIIMSPQFEQVISSVKRYSRTCPRGVEHFDRILCCTASNVALSTSADLHALEKAAEKAATKGTLGVPFGALESDVEALVRLIP